MSFFQEKKDVRVVPLTNWLDWAGGRKSDVFVALPMIQRGSVWKPHQIIDLWDSLLQGMPIGSLMGSELKPGMKVRRLGQSESTAVDSNGGLGLIDGQQRTLAMLAAWPLANEIKMDRRIWIDFADNPPPGQLFRLRVTTVNQPFGFRTDEPSSKLSLNDRRKAQDLYELMQKDKPTLENAWPYTSKPTIPIDLRWLINKWRGNDPTSWEKIVLEEIAKIKSEREAWHTSSSDNEIIKKRVDELNIALTRLSNMEVPLIRVDDRFFAIDDSKESEQSDPPLALLFKRIGTGGTKLSDADYVYSIIKHLRPETHDLVESLYEPKDGKRNVSRLLTATDLVMSAVRLAAVTGLLNDRESLGKQEFHRLLRQGEFLKDYFFPLIEAKPPETEKSPIVQYFLQIQVCLEYKGDGDIGLPRHMFPHLGRPLVQVLLRLAQAGYLTDLNDERRHDVLRLVLFWILSVKDQGKASKIAYEVILERNGEYNQIGYAIHAALISKTIALCLVEPDIIKARPNLAISLNDKKLCNYSRFEPATDNGNQDEKQYAHVYELYQRWWRPWTYHHPMLLWLQREYVAKKETWSDPMAGREDDTPYDYDHLLPSSHWNDWRGAGCPSSFSNGNIGIIGNGIGNVRVWDSSDNRKDGDKAPKIKLKITPESNDSGLLNEQNPTSAELLKWSAIDSEQQQAWINCSPESDKLKRNWDEPNRTTDFQRAVELRTFYLYKRFYHELGFSTWLEPEKTTTQNESS